MSQTLPSLLPAPSTVDRMAAAACHASFVLGVPMVVPICVIAGYALLRPEADYPRNQAMQALLYHLLITAISGALIGLAIVLGLGAFWSYGVAISQGADPTTLSVPAHWGGPVASLLAGLLVMLWGQIKSLIALYRTLQGIRYQLPVVGRWLT